MTWLKLDDNFADHPKVLAAGPDAVMLWLTGLCYAGRHLTDGRVPRGIFHDQALTDRLVDVGLLEPDDDGCYRIHDFLDFNPSRADVEADREAAKQRMQKVRAKKKRSPERSGEQSENFDRGSASPTRPDPTRTRPVSDVRESSDDDDSRAVSAESSSDDDLHDRVLRAVAGRVADDRGGFEVSREAFEAGVLRNLRLERGADLRAYLAGRPDATEDQLVAWLYAGVDPDLLAGFDERDEHEAVA